ncbi:MAG: two-component sensor histidine kinase [Phycisphaerales bacterium]|nr:two-component sensor histidine kinase [Phycisphaerales bacterium]
MSDFWLGILIGAALDLLILVPLVYFLLRRTEQRTQTMARKARATERLAELGMLTGGLAHEIKNPLSSVGLNIQLVQEDLVDLARTQEPSPEKIGRVQRRVDSLARETQRLRDILDDFLRYAGRMKLDRVPVDVNQLVTELADFFLPQAQVMGVRIRTELSPQSITLQADPALLKQAMLNLMINATQAMAEARSAQKPHGGADELILRTRTHGPASNLEAVIDIIDTGPGIAAEVLPKIFQPYFSTKKGGTGLGLPTTRRIIEEHQGHLHVHSDLGRGSDFSIHLTVKQSS